MWRNNKPKIVASVGALAIGVGVAGASGAFSRGEVKAVRSVPLTAPTTGGGDLQILELAKNGMNIKKGDVVVRFDPMTVQRTLNDRRSDFKQAEDEIDKTRAQYRMQEQQAETDVTTARYNVRRA